jgi:hypothetical protein
MKRETKDTRVQTDRPCNSAIAKPCLPNQARIRIIRKRAEARQELEWAVIEFLDSMLAGGEGKLDHNPNSRDLLPYFEVYAKSIFDAVVQELLPSPLPISAKLAVLQDVVHKIVQDICSAE